jgi:hypothetical protein
VSIPVLTSTPMKPERFKNALLHRVANPEWEQDLRYLRELYSQIALEQSNEMDSGEMRFDSTEPKVRELLVTLRSIADTAPDTQAAIQDFERAMVHADLRDYETANADLNNALANINRQIGALSKMGSTKLGYGYDIGGQVQNGGGTSGEGRHLWDTGNAPKHDHTTSNPANMMFDAEAESDYPELAKLKHKRVHWPPRTR